MNSVIEIGRIATDINLQYTPQTQTAVAKFTLAVDRPKKDGQDQGADFIRITVWGRQAETTNQYCSKGSKIAVQGRITTGSYKDRQGNTVYTTEVTAERVEFLDSRTQPMQDTVNNMGMPQPVAQETTGTAFTHDEAVLPWEQ